MKKKYSFSEQIKFAIILLSVSIFLVLSDWLWRWDQHFYDLQMRQWTKPAPSQVVLVTIDESSLAEIGQWPWSREIHARLLNILQKSGAETIIFDIIFSEKSKLDPAGDDYFATAIRSAKNVVLPVLLEQVKPGGQLKETLPLGKFIDAGAHLGHVHIELDVDGIARSTYLYEGLGDPHWPHISLKALQLESPTLTSFNLESNIESKSPYLWYRDLHRLIPFRGPPGHFNSISFKDVIAGNFSSNAFHKKTVFVGVTATGLGDTLPTPVSGLSHPMSGVEINANIYAALSDNHNITPLKPRTRIVLSIIIVLLPVLIFSLVSPRLALIISGALIGLTLFISFILLNYLSLWFPPLSAVIALSLSYPIWSWRRLEAAKKYFDAQLIELNKEPGLLSDQSSLDIVSVIKSYCTLLSCDGWCMYDSNGKCLKSVNVQDVTLPKFSATKACREEGSIFWINCNKYNHELLIGLKFSNLKNLSLQHRKLLDLLVNQLYEDVKITPSGSFELIESQIQQVQSASTRIRIMRQFVSESLNQMADAIIIASPLGNILFFNRQASNMFNNENLDGELLPNLLLHCDMAENETWENLIVRIITNNEIVSVQFKMTDKKEWLGYLSPFVDEQSGIQGIIINFSDISQIKELEHKQAEYVNFLSHDSRAPLNSALALIEISKQNQKKISLETMNRLSAYVNQTMNLIEQFTQLSRAENIDESYFEIINFVDVLIYAIDQLWELAMGKNIQIKFENNVDVAMLRGDAALLERAIVNLLNNAIKYSPSDTNITVELSRKNNQYQCCVIDQGIGIAQEKIPQLFDRFRRLTSQESIKETGTGLGLTFVKLVIEAHHGTIHVNSKVNNGSCFTIHLPKV